MEKLTRKLRPEAKYGADLENLVVAGELDAAVAAHARRAYSYTYTHFWRRSSTSATARASYTLGPPGNLWPCNHTPTILGNLWQEPLGEILARERLAPFVSAIPPFCDPCPLRERCQGGCRAAAQVCYGSLWAEDPFLHRHRDQTRPGR